MEIPARWLRQDLHNIQNGGAHSQYGVFEVEQMMYLSALHVCLLGWYWNYRGESRRVKLNLPTLIVSPSTSLRNS